MECLNTISTHWQLFSLSLKYTCLSLRTETLRKRIFQMIVHGGQFGSKLEGKSSELVRKLRAPTYSTMLCLNLILMTRIFEKYCSQGMILNSCDPFPPYFCSPNLHFQGISFASIISLCWDIWKYGLFL